MRISARPFALLLATMLTLSVSARAGTKLGETLLGVTGDSVMGVMGMHDMKGGRWVVQVSPGYITGKVNTAFGTGENFSMKGYSMAFAIKREFTANWGAGLIGGFTKQSGNSTLSTPSGLAPDTAFPEVPTVPGVRRSGYSGGTISGMYGNALGVMLTLDPFSNPDGFRMPISVGPMMLWEGIKFRHEFNNPNLGNAAQVDTAEVKRSDLGFFSNISFDFIFFKDFRVMPGIALGFAPGKSNYAKYDYNVTRGGVTTAFAHETAMQPMWTSVYASFLYRPWDVNVNYIVMSGADQLKNYSITVGKKFGGKS